MFPELGSREQAKRSVISIPARGQKSGEYIPCEICGKETYFVNSRIKKNKHFYCSPECSAKGTHLIGSEERICEYCGNMFTTIKSDPKKFCSIECQHQWQKGNTGDLNPRYTRKAHQCDYCGKTHIVKNYKLNQDHIFCSTKCRQDWYAKVWSQSDEWRDKSKERAIEILSSGKISHTNSKPQEIIDNMLNDTGVSYIREKPIMTYSVDNYLDEHNLCIEVMGDFWHANPNKYLFPKYDKQTKTIQRDIKKRECIKNKTGHYPLYLWESEILHDSRLCRCLINEYIKQDGELPNYNSFNYSINNNKPIIKEDITLSFQEQTNAANA